MTTRAVVDASVVVKWLLRDSPRERDTGAAASLLDAVAAGAIEPLQPPHWLAEVLAVMARVEPATAAETARLLHALEWPVLDDPDLYVEASALADRLGHHLFDTLYHAVTRCEPATVCITADEAYYRKAQGLGGLVLLRDLTFD